MTATATRRKRAGGVQHFTEPTHAEAATRIRELDRSLPDGWHSGATLHRDSQTGRVWYATYRYPTEGGAKLAEAIIDVAERSEFDEERYAAWHARFAAERRAELEGL